MPPEDMVRPWMLLTGTRIAVTAASAYSLSYTVKDPSNRQAYWGGVSGEYSPLWKFMTKSSSEIRSTAAEVTTGAASPEAKLEKIYEFCQSQIKNTTFDTSLTDEDRTKLPEVKAISDVLKRRSASSQYVDLLFGSLANAAGFETRIALSGNRSEMFFEPNMTNESLIHPAAIAVKVGDQWKFFNPGMPYLPFGMLVWYEEDTWALMVGEKDYLWQRTPLTSHEKSLAKRNGKFKLLDDGTLEGTVNIEYTGQPALTYRTDNYDETADKRIENLKEAIKQRISTAEISNVQIENVADASKPLVQRYAVRIPGYAQKTGKRLFLQPGYFEFGTSPVFSSASRKYDLFFRYPWAETDRIEYHLPAGFALDSADAPGVIADTDKIGSLNVEMGVSKDGSLLVYDRRFHFGGGGHILFKVGSYTSLKNMFDLFQKAETHAVTLKQQ